MVVTRRERNRRKETNIGDTVPTSLGTTSRMQGTVRKELEERKSYIINSFIHVSQLRCLQQHWFSASVFVDAINKYTLPEKHASKEEMLRAVRKQVFTKRAITLAFMRRSEEWKILTLVMGRDKGIIFSGVE